MDEAKTQEWFTAGVAGGGEAAVTNAAAGLLSAAVFQVLHPHAHLQCQSTSLGPSAGEPHDTTAWPRICCQRVPVLGAVAERIGRTLNLTTHAQSLTYGPWSDFMMPR